MGDRFGVGIDDTHIKLRGAPVLDEVRIATTLQSPTRVQEVLIGRGASRSA